MLEYLSDTLIKAATSLVILPVILVVLLAVVVLFIDRITRARPDIVAQEKYRYERYEAGNPPPKSEARGKVSMQYLGYLIVFLAVEPAVVIFAILLAAPEIVLGKLLWLYAALVAVYAPLLVYALRESRRVESWMLEG
ncbi:MAG: NAD(P)H-quinone oxidoreductase subunit 3 [Crenarchaeota archaeon]|nr:NAD(P)H-quinone oxidoreductase subunit 3 [Thermoproteota archaeon]